MELTSEDIEILVGTANALLRSPEVRRMNGFLQHGRTSCLQHSLAVAYVSLCLRRLLHMRADRHSLVRGALLHDFFLYDWHEKHAGHNLHGWTHPATALRNARAAFCAERGGAEHHLQPYVALYPATASPQPGGDAGQSGGQNLFRPRGLPRLPLSLHAPAAANQPAGLDRILLSMTAAAPEIVYPAPSSVFSLPFLPSTPGSGFARMAVRETSLPQGFYICI